MECKKNVNQGKIDIWPVLNPKYVIYNLFRAEISKQPDFLAIATLITNPIK
tara:strand:+ start:2010 stop:2162 length:153 start_codon:yes stop_codon:yes gene_type:complete